MDYGNSSEQVLIDQTRESVSALGYGEPRFRRAPSLCANSVLLRDWFGGYSVGK